MLQVAGSLRDTLSPDPEHISDEFLRYDELTALQPINIKQEPSTELLIHRVMPIAYAGLRNLRHQCLRKPQQQARDRRYELELVLHERRFHPQRFAGTLNDCTAWGAVSTHEQCDSHYPFIANDGNLRRSSVLQDIKQGDDRCEGEINVGQATLRFVDDLAQLQINLFEVWLPKRPDRLG
jgi:hypothetical protein